MHFSFRRGLRSRQRDLTCRTARAGRHGYAGAQPVTAYLNLRVANTGALVFREIRIDGKLGVKETMDSGFRTSVRHGGVRLPGVWHVIRSFFGDVTPLRKALPPRIPIVALVADEQDRRVLATVSGQEEYEVHFVTSSEEACAVANQLAAPVILFDRDWPGTQWRSSIQSLAALPQGACVVLMSGVSDDYLLQELIRRGGYDVLPKPLRTDSVVRLVKLALSYWNSVPRSAVLTPRS